MKLAQRHGVLVVDTSANLPQQLRTQSLVTELPAGAAAAMRAQDMMVSVGPNTEAPTEFTVGGRTFVRGGFYDTQQGLIRSYSGDNSLVAHEIGHAMVDAALLPRLAQAEVEATTQGTQAGQRGLALINHEANILSAANDGMPPEYQSKLGEAMHQFETTIRAEGAPSPYAQAYVDAERQGKGWGVDVHSTYVSDPFGDGDNSILERVHAAMTRAANESFAEYTAALLTGTYYGRSRFDEASGIPEKEQWKTLSTTRAQALAGLARQRPGSVMAFAKLWQALTPRDQPAKRSDATMRTVGLSKEWKQWGV